MSLPPVRGLKLQMEIDLGNAEMETAFDVADAFSRSLAVYGDYGKLTGGMSREIRDNNGNRVGAWSVVEDRRTT